MVAKANLRNLGRKYVNMKISTYHKSLHHHWRPNWTKTTCNKQTIQCCCIKIIWISQIWFWAIPWWRLWPKFENFSLLIDHSSYNKQAINHFVVDVRSTLGGQSTATPPQKLTSVKVKHSVHVTPGDVCDFARKWVLPLNRYKAQFLWSVIEFCVNIYIFDGRHIA